MGSRHMMAAVGLTLFCGACGGPEVLASATGPDPGPGTETGSPAATDGSTGGESSGSSSSGSAGDSGEGSGGHDGGSTGDPDVGTGAPPLDVGDRPLPDVGDGGTTGDDPVADVGQVADVFEPLCGNGVLDAGEECDGQAGLAGLSCAQFDGEIYDALVEISDQGDTYPQQFFSDSYGSLGCAATCTYAILACDIECTIPPDTLLGQNHIENLAYCTRITSPGSVHFWGPGVTDLEPLAVLEEIDALQLAVTSTNLVSLAPLAGLAQMHGNIYVSGNAQLTTLGGAFTNLDQYTTPVMAPWPDGKVVLNSMLVCQTELASTVDHLEDLGFVGYVDATGDAC